MRVLVAHSYFLAHDAKQLARMTPYSPLSTLIGAALLRGEGHDVSLFDATFAQNVGAFSAMLERERPDAVAILEDNFNFLTKMCTLKRRQAAFAMIKAACAHGCRVAVNGPDSADQPENYLDAGAEVVLTGEGGTAVAELMAAWSRNQDHSQIAGLILQAPDGQIRRTRARRDAGEQDSLPLPAWDLADAALYRQAWTKAHGYFSWNMATSRGCPYACNWCAKPTFGRGYTQRPARAVAEELALLKAQIAPDHVWFADDIFGLTPGWLESFATEVRQRDARIPFTMQSRVNLMQPRAVAALADAGAQEIWLGVESGAQKILDAMDKGSRVEEIRNATQALRAHNIRACWFIQLGYPGESWEDILLTRDLIRDEQPDDIGVSVAYPLPGTRFHEMVQAELGARRNWEDSDDLAMLFQGTFDTGFYRMVRDALHDEAREHHRDDCRWARLGHEATRHRSANPVLLATGS